MRFSLAHSERPLSTLVITDTINVPRANGVLPVARITSVFGARRSTSRSLGVLANDIAVQRIGIDS